jgi:hypothetical protein
MFNDPYKNINGHDVEKSKNDSSAIELIHGRSQRQSSFIQTTTDATTSTKIITFVIVICVIGLLTGITFGIIDDMESQGDKNPAIVLNTHRHIPSTSTLIASSRITKENYDVREISKAFTIEHGPITFKATNNISAVSIKNTARDDQDPSMELQLAIKDRAFDHLEVSFAVRKTWSTSQIFEECSRPTNHNCEVLEPLAKNNFDLTIKEKVSGSARGHIYKQYYRATNGADVMIEYRPYDDDQKEKDSLAIVKEVHDTLTADDNATPYAMDMATYIRLPYNNYIGTYREVDEIDFKEDRVTFSPLNSKTVKNYTIDVWTSGNSDSGYKKVKEFNSPKAIMYQNALGKTYFTLTDDYNYVYDVAIHYVDNNLETKYIQTALEVRDIFKAIFGDS